MVHVIRLGQLVLRCILILNALIYSLKCLYSVLDLVLHHALMLLLVMVHHQLLIQQHHQLQRTNQVVQSQHIAHQNLSLLPLPFIARTSLPP